MKLKEIEKSSIDFSDAMEIAQNAIMTRLNCHNIGKIIEFDANTQTCTVQLMVLKQFYNNIIEPAPITNVPLIMYGASNGFITLPNPVGSICLLMFLDRNSDKFLQTGEQYLPETTRTHDYTDCVAITTFSTLNNPIQNYDDTAISIIHNKIIEEVVYESVIKNYADSILLKYNKDNNGTPTYSQIQLKDKINIRNTTRNLATLIKTLIGHIKDLTITQGVVSDASKANLNADITAFGELLE